MSSQGRGRGRGRGGRGRGSLNHMVVDHRPKALTVGGFMEEEKDDLLQHFSVSFLRWSNFSKIFFLQAQCLIQICLIQIYVCCAWDTANAL